RSSPASIGIRHRDRRIEPYRTPDKTGLRRVRIGFTTTRRTIDRTGRKRIHRILPYFQPAPDLMLAVDPETIPLEIGVGDHPLFILIVARKAVIGIFIASPHGDIGIRHIPITQQSPLPVRTLRSIVRIAPNGWHTQI